MYKKMISIFLYAFLWLFFCSNQNKNANTDTLPEAYFDIDSAKIGKLFQNDDYGIRFNPPRAWELVSPEIFEKISEHVSYRGSDQEFSFKPIYIFLDQENGSMLSISVLSSVDDTVSTEDLLKRYRELLDVRFGSSELKKVAFSKDGIGFLQFLIQEKDKVIFKLLFENLENQVIQLDYIVSRTIYPSEVKAIESSIGSILLVRKGGRTW